MENHTKVLLLDFYGSVLTPKQYEYMDLHCNEDLSFAEIAAQKDISRQGVFDLVKRSQDLLLKMEDQLGFIARFKERTMAAEQVKSILEALSKNSNGDYIVSNKLMNELKSRVNTIINGDLEESI